MSLVGRYDPSPRAIMEPEALFPPVEGFPKAAVSCFSHYIIEAAVAGGGAEEITRLPTSAGPIPIYRMRAGEADVALFCSPVGAPAAVGAMEEVRAMGARNFVFFGSCGVLDGAIPEGDVLVPTAAVRDEGTSYHYLPAADEIELDEANVARVCQALGRQGLPYRRCKLWTTDALYRETEARVAERRAMGCAAVEMECASLAAAARFRGLGFAQFVYAEDNLDAPEWDKRNLDDYGCTRGPKYLAAALEIAAELILLNN